MRPLVRDQVLVVLVGAVVFLTNLGGAPLFDEDEPKNAACGREMFARGDFVVPTFDEQLRTDKPVLLYWLMIGAYALFGVSEFAARLPSAALALGTVLATYHIGRRLFDRWSGLLAAVVLASSLMFAAVGRAATPDSTLVFCVTTAMLVFTWSVPWGDVPGASGRVPRRWQQFALLYAAMGLAVLAKGPVGFVLPCAVIGTFLLCVSYHAEEPAAAVCEGRLRRGFGAAGRFLHPWRLWSVAWSMRPLTLLLMLAVVALPWYVVVGLQTDGAWLAGFLGNHNVGRFLRPMEKHGGPIFYYVIAILAGMFPWSVFLGPALLRAREKFRQRAADAPGLVFALCWAGVYVVFFSLARTKLPNYVLPAYPALALLVGRFVSEWSVRAEFSERRLVRWGLSSSALVGTAVLIGLPVAARLVLPGESALGLIGVVLLAGTAAAFWFVRRREPGRVVLAYATASVGFVAAALSFAAPEAAKHQEGPALVAAARAAGGGDLSLATFDYFSPNLVFYARQEVERLRTPEMVRDYFARENRPFLVLRADRLAEVEPVLPADVGIVTSRPRFLRRQDVVLLGRRGVTTAARERGSAIR